MGTQKHGKPPIKPDNAAAEAIWKCFINWEDYQKLILYMLSRPLSEVRTLLEKFLDEHALMRTGKGRNMEAVAEYFEAAWEDPSRRAYLLAVSESETQWTYLKQILTGGLSSSDQVMAIKQHAATLNIANFDDQDARWFLREIDHPDGVGLIPT